MKFQKSAVALVMAGVLAAPTIAVAEGSAYASIRLGLMSESKKQTGSDTVSDLTLNNPGSRMGFKGETDLGGGLTTFGQYEFGVSSVTNGDAVTLRHSFVGLKGDFGSLTLGHTGHTFYNYVFAPVDNVWWESGNAAILAKSRTSNGLTYSGDFGPVSFGATLYLAGDARSSAGKAKQIDGTEFGLSYDAGVVKVAYGMYQDEDELQTPDSKKPDPVTGLAISGSNAGIGWALNSQSQKVADGTNSSLALDLTYAGGYFHYESITVKQPDGASDQKPNAITIGYSHGLGPRTSAWYELVNVKKDDANKAEEQRIRAILKYEIL